MDIEPLPPHWDVTDIVIGAFRAVYNKLGTGFLEQVYVRALELECIKRGLTVRREAQVEVRYDGVIVGRYRIDLLINDVVIVEVKSDVRSSVHCAQVLNYLRCSRITVGLLLYFSNEPDFRRVTCRERQMKEGQMNPETTVTTETAQRRE